MKNPANFAQTRETKWAAILDKFPGLTPDDLGEMTDCQIERLYLHPRDKDGRIIPRETPEEKKGPTVEQHIATYLAVVRSANRSRPGSFPLEVVEARIKAIREHHARKEQKQCQPPQ